MPPSPYLDEAGRPRLRQSLVGFLDLLGFSHQVVSARDGDDARALLDKIVTAIADSRARVRQALAAEFAKFDQRAVLKFFSDNLVVAYDLEGAELVESVSFLVRCVQHYQLEMTLRGLFLRGALTLGPASISDDIIFGGALIECYQHESKVSIVPRVILAEPLSRALASAHPGAAGASLKGTLCRDVDGWWFVNYLAAAVRGDEVDWPSIELHKQRILESLASTTRHDVLPKFGWVCRYHNMFCSWHRQAEGYRDEYAIHRDGEASVMLPWE
jgi:hypothetical protein